MRIAIISLSVLIGAVSCGEFNQIGDPVDTQNAISMKEAFKEYQNSGKSEFIVFGRVKEVCQSEGCWFSYDLHDRTITVDFNEKFTVPKGIAKKDLYATGQFYQDTSWNDDATDTTAATYTIDTKFLAQGVRFK
jgi:hypothetical protein